MARAFILVMDSFGIGACADAAAFGDEGADTLGHIAEACAKGLADGEGLRQGPLSLPNLARLGLGRAAEESTSKRQESWASCAAIEGAYGHAAERSRGKDTPSGHWEIAGVPVAFDWGYFPRTRPCFPEEITTALIEGFELPGILGNCHASGTEVIRELGTQHIESGKPICYTSADSVFQIAAHEEHFGLQRLYDLCSLAKALLEPLNIARVIARPFVGESPETFERTGNRRDYTTPPHEDTLLDRLMAEGREVVSIGKIADIFAQRGISRKVKADGNEALFDSLLQESDAAADGSLVFANFVDFDMLYGHRRNVPGYAAALEAFDRRLPSFEARMKPGDLALITADHGCDPTKPGSDHTREHVPVVFFGPGVPEAYRGKSLGRRSSFADMGQTLAGHLGIAPLPHGKGCFTP